MLIVLVFLTVDSLATALYWDRKVEFVYASVHDHALAGLERIRRWVEALEALASSAAAGRALPVIRNLVYQALTN
jgi:hypothetical protein